MKVTDILDEKGKVVNGAFSFYVLPNGVVFFSEDVEETPDTYKFDLKKTAIVQLQSVSGGVGIMAMKAYEHVSLFNAATIYIQPKASCARTNSSNAELYANCRKTASTIDLVIGPHR